MKKNNASERISVTAEERSVFPRTQSKSSIRSSHVRDHDRSRGGRGNTLAKEQTDSLTTA